MSSRRFQVECELTNTSSGPTKRRVAEAIVDTRGLVVLKPLRGDLYTIRIIDGSNRFIAPARVSAVKGSRTELTWINLLDSDHKDLSTILGADTGTQSPGNDIQAA